MIPFFALGIIVNPVKIPDMIYLVNIYSRWHWFSGILYIQQRQDFARIPLSFDIVPKELIHGQATLDLYRRTMILQVLACFLGEL